eukprot:7626387-Pyramimonas_sp.AAC.1
MEERGAVIPTLQILMGKFGAVNKRSQSPLLEILAFKLLLIFIASQTVKTMRFFQSEEKAERSN